MSRKEVRALIVESDASRANRVATLLGRSTETSFYCATASSLARANKLLHEKRWDIVLSALELVDAKGLDSLVSFHPARSDTPVVSLVEGAEPDAVLNAARSLSDECLFWEELGEDCLIESVNYALERCRMLRDLKGQQSDEGPKQSELLYREILDRIDEAIFVVSRLDGTLLYSNETARKWFGANMGEALEDVLEYDLLEAEEVRMEISTKIPNCLRAELRSKTLPWNEELACFISLRDLSKQKRAEDAFLASQRRLELATREAGFWSWDLVSDMVRFSDAFRRTLGYKISDFGDALDSFEGAVHPEDRSRVMDGFRRFASDDSEGIEVKFRIRCADGLYAEVLSKGGRTVSRGSGQIVFAGTLHRLSDKRELYVLPPSDKLEPIKEEAKKKADAGQETSERGIALIVDDEEVLRKALDSILSSYGFSTRVATDGGEGIELYEKYRSQIEIVVLDMNMPRIDGSKVFARIRSDGPRIPIVMTSGNDDKQALPFTDGERENCDFLLKPFGLADVKRIVERFLSKPAESTSA